MCNNNIKKTCSEMPHCKPLRSNCYALCTIKSRDDTKRSTWLSLSRGLVRVPAFLSPVKKKIGLRLGNDLWGDLFCPIIIEMIPFILIFDIGVIMPRICSV